MLKRMWMVFLLISTLWTTSDEKAFPICFPGCGVFKQVLHCSYLMNKDLQKLSMCIKRHRGILVIDIRNHQLTCSCPFVQFIRSVKLQEQNILFHSTVCDSKHIAMCDESLEVQSTTGDKAPVLGIFGGRVFYLNGPDFDGRLIGWDQKRKAIISGMRAQFIRDKYARIEANVFARAKKSAHSMIHYRSISPSEIYDDDDDDDYDDDDDIIIQKLDMLSDEPGFAGPLATEILILIILHVLGMTIIIVLMITKRCPDGFKGLTTQGTGGYFDRKTGKTSKSRDLSTEEKWKSYLKQPTAPTESGSYDKKSDATTSESLKQLRDEMKHRDEDRKTAGSKTYSQDNSEGYSRGYSQESGDSSEYTTGYMEGYSGSSPYCSQDYSKGSSQDYSEGYTPDYSEGYTPDYSVGYSHGYSQDYSGYSQDYSEGYCDSYDYSQDYSQDYSPEYSQDYSPEYSQDYLPGFSQDYSTEFSGIVEGYIEESDHKRRPRSRRDPPKITIHSVQCHQEPKLKDLDTKAGNYQLKRDVSSQVTKLDMCQQKANTEGQRIKVDTYVQEPDDAGQEADNEDMPLEGPSTSQQSDKDKKSVTFEQKLEAATQDKVVDVNKQETVTKKKKRHHVERSMLTNRARQQKVKKGQQTEVFAMDYQKGHSSRQQSTEEYHEVERQEGNKETEEAEKRQKEEEKRQEEEEEEKRQEEEEKKRQEEEEKRQEEQKRLQEEEEKRLQEEEEKRLQERQKEIQQQRQQQEEERQAERRGEKEDEWYRVDKKYMQVPIITLKNSVPYTEYLTVEVNPNSNKRENTKAQRKSVETKNEFAGVHAAEFIYAVSKEDRRRIGKPQQYEESPTFVLHNVASKDSINESDLHKKMLKRQMKKKMAECQRQQDQEAIRRYIGFTDKETCQRERRRRAEKEALKQQYYQTVWINNNHETDSEETMQGRYVHTQQHGTKTRSKVNDSEEAMQGRHVHTQQHRTKTRSKDPHTVKQKKHKDEFHK
ncbi:rac guanine nucleotide exchange factor JJ-like isoform X2 [Gigantopelta aegis]|uniref:rac guanine nucleotide exchange factor JJ-like isoform X2 n=1 Tax=Gigantopelta aegis TaxID=1735272 RepID=UPI001B888083|nr:rac guanine nucleotide exchange factor JJ-like isoform X2 [Gigantopelta aegis]